MRLADLRKEEHFQARDHMAKGDFRSALNTIKSAQLEYGDHILMTLDLAACYYMINDYHLFEKVARKGLEDFQAFREFFEEKTLIFGANALGKYFEELGDFKISLKMYELATDGINDQDIHLTAQIHAQRLRLKAFLGYQDRFSEDYNLCQRTLATFDAGAMSSVTFEIHHALILADHFLHNKATQDRFDSVFPFLKEEYQKRLFVIDHVVERISNSVSLFDLADWFRPLIMQISYVNADPYERAIINLLDSKTADLSQLHLMPLQGKFRYLLLLKKFHQDVEIEKSEIETQLNLLIKMFSNEIRSLLKARWNIVASEKLVTIEISNSQVCLSNSAVTICFSRTSLYGKLLCLSARYRDQQKIPIELILQEVYDEDLSISGFEKLRQLVVRLNQKINREFMIDKLFSVSNEGIIQLIPYSTDFTS